MPITPGSGRRGRHLRNQRPRPQLPDQTNNIARVIHMQAVWDAGAGQIATNITFSKSITGGDATHVKILCGGIDQTANISGYGHANNVVGFTINGDFTGVANVTIICQATDWVIFDDGTGIEVGATFQCPLTT